MTRHVTLVDYGLGNLLSVSRALEKVGSRIRVEITQDPSKVRTADRLIVPGVGAFGDGMRALNQLGLDGAILDFVRTNRPLLGICLGMQMLVDESEEFGRMTGLSIVEGKVRLIPSAGADGKTQRKIPHIGWNALSTSSERGWKGSLLEGISDGAAAYFVHSFSVHLGDSRDLLGFCDYGGVCLTAALSKANIHGCQFHPEKSGPVGLRILSNFVNL